MNRNNYLAIMIAVAVLLAIVGSRQRYEIRKLLEEAERLAERKEALADTKPTARSHRAAPETPVAMDVETAPREEVEAANEPADESVAKAVEEEPESAVSKNPFLEMFNDPELRESLRTLWSRNWKQYTDHSYVPTR